MTYKYNIGSRMATPFDCEGRALKKSPVDCFSEGASRRLEKEH